MSAPAKDRFLALRESTTLNGIDFVEVLAAPPAGELRVHFVNAVTVDEPGLTATITGGDRVPTVAVEPIVPADWSADAEGRPVLAVHALADGDFSNYTLRLSSSRLDRFFRETRFSFKVACPSDFDCAPVPITCPPDDIVAPPIDYLAKDYGSFKRALSDFSALRYPDWEERSEADFGVMFLEALSGLADEMSYVQDRVSAEAALETATERRSIERLARLVDYQPRPATSARTLLACNVTSGPVPAGVRVSAETPAGAVIPFEIGRGLADHASYVTDPRWNDPIPPYWWDDDRRCLLPGTTEMYVAGQGFGFFPGQAVLIDTDAPNTADPPTREVVHLTDVEELLDPLFGSAPVTRIAWSAAEALRYEHDLTRTHLAGNVLPATQGRRFSESFAIEKAPLTSPGMPLAIVRRAANSTPGAPAWDYLHSLRQAPLAWLAGDDPEAPPAPEITLTRKAPVVDAWAWTTPLLKASEFENVFTTEPATYRPIPFPGGTHREYDGDRGETLRFGDGTFGARPDAEDVFEAVYRVGAGEAGNVAPDSITVIDPAWTGLLSAAWNPFPAQGGADRETAERVRRLAPQAFRARQFRAVRAEDYEAEAERLPWVQQAGTAFRWTGSWLTVFTTPDPKGGGALPLERHTELIHLLNRRRLAGYESYVPPARYVSIDLRIVVCATPEAFQGDVERDVLDRLGSSRRASGAVGFFFADRFTFGTPLERSRLEAAIQATPGVAGVLKVQYRRRGFVPAFVDLPDVLPLAPDEILRVDNDPDFPERGSLKVIVQGGK